MAFGRDRGEDITMKPSAPSGAAPSGGLTAFIDQGSSFEGKLSFKDTVRIDGHFTGDISSENTLIIGETGEIEANIRSKTVIISGSVSGDIVAGTKVVLHKSARMQGNIDSPSLMVEEGAAFNGQVKMPLPDSLKKGGSVTSLKGGAASPNQGDSSDQS